MSFILKFEIFKLKVFHDTDTGLEVIWPYAYVHSRTGDGNAAFLFDLLPV